MKRMLLIRRKGFNYYTDYTELYLHRAFQNYGYSVVRDKDNSDFSVIAYISENEKYMKMISPFFDELSESEIANLCELFSEAFKSEVLMSEATQGEFDYINEYEFMLSKNHSAYDEPPFLYDDPPRLEKITYFVRFKTNKEGSMGFVSVGGRLSGLDITFEFDDYIDDLEFTDAQIMYYENKVRLWRDIIFKKDKQSFSAKVDFLNFDKGVNPKSAVMRGKKRYNEEIYNGFWLSVLPVCKNDIILEGTLTISTDGVEIFKSVI